MKNIERELSKLNYMRIERANFLFVSMRVRLARLEDSIMFDTPPFHELSHCGGSFEVLFLSYVSP